MAEQVLFELEGWPGGFNRSVDETALVAEELLDAVNVVVDERGDVASRPGYSDGRASGESHQLVTITEWWPNADSKSILVGRTADDTYVYIVRNQSAAPFSIERVDAGYTGGSYTTPTINFFATSFCSLNSDDLYIVDKRGTDAVEKLVWVNDATAPSAVTVSKATFDMPDLVPDHEEGTLTFTATGGTYDIGAAGDVAELPYNATAPEIQAAIRGLNSFGTTMKVSGFGPYYFVMAETDPPLVMDPADLNGGSATYVVTSTSVEPDNQFPPARFGLVKHSRMWVANVEADGTDYPSRVYYSDVLKPEKWYGLQYFDFDPYDGQEITGFQPYGEAILVFKNHNISILTGKTEESFAITVLDEEVGTTSPKSIAVVGANLLFLDRDRGVWHFDGAEFVGVSDQFRDYLLDNLNYEYAFTASGFIRRGVYYLSVPWTTSKTPNHMFCYDIKGKLWYEWSFGSNSAAVWNGETFAAVDGEDCYMQLFDGVDDNASPITSYMTTGWLAPGGDGAQHRIRRLDASFASEGYDQAVDVGAYRDYETLEYNKERVTPDGTALFQRIGGFGNKRWKQIKLQIASVSGSAWRLNRLSLRLTVAKRGRGVDSPNG